MSASELFQKLAATRLEGRALWAGVALVASLAIPYEMLEGMPQFAWQLVSELPPAAVMASLALPAAGIVLLVARFACRRASSLAIVLLAAIGGAGLVHKIGADAAAWGALPLPQTVAQRTPVALFALAASASGANLTQRRATRRPARWLLCAGVALAAAFFLWPGRGEAPARSIGRNLAAIPSLPTVHFQLGALTLAVVALWPAIVPLAGLGYLRSPARHAPSAIGILGLFGYPLLLMMLLFAWAMRAGVDGTQLGSVAAAIVVAVQLVAIAGAFEGLAETVFADPRADDADRAADTADGVEEAIAAEAAAARGSLAGDGWPPGRTLAVCAGVVGALVVTESVVSRPPAKGIDWQLGAPSEEADALFGTLVPRWSASRWYWRRAALERSNAGALLDVKAAAREMVSAAGKIDPALGTSLAALADAGSDLDVSARAWFRLVSDANAVCRVHALPYYLDPRVSLRRQKAGLERLLLVDTYRVARVRQFEAGGERYAVLHVRELDASGEHNPGLLGFSRDLQPFALVALRAVDTHVRDLSERASGAPVRCGAAPDFESDRVMLRCGELLASVARELGPGFGAALLAGTERHELQHQMDGPLLPLAGAVTRELGAYRDDARIRVNRELSAHVSELTTASPRVALLTPLVAAANGGSGTYHLAGVLMFEALTGRNLRGAAGQLDLAELTAAFDELAALGDGDLRARAAAAWRDLYGDDLPEVRFITENSALGGGSSVP